jgi:serine-type D-Ala-D-Ala carboxypeptidase/endopeptidase (penicillin-binding protein 4)
MKRTVRRTTLSLLLPTVAACASAPVAPSASPALADEIDALVSAPPVHRATWGILVTDAATGAVLYRRNADQLLIPASNMKLTVTATALGTLGPDWHYSTELRAVPQTSGTTPLLVVTGSGDPTWSTRFHATVTAPFDSLAAVVQRAGIRRIERLIVDASRFRDSPVHPTWEISDLPGVFAPPTDAFAAAEGTFRLALFGGPLPGTPGWTQVVPPLAQPVRASVTTDTIGHPRTMAIDLLDRRDTIRMEVRIAPGARDTTVHAVTSPATAAAAAVVHAFNARGISVGGTELVRDTAAARAIRNGTAPIGAVRSPPLSAIVAAILRPSQNWVSEQLLKTLGAELGGDGSWRGGNEVQRRYLIDTAGVDSTGFLLRDASGMSAQNLLAPSLTVALLAHARAQGWYAVYRDAMAQPGLRGSTLGNRLLPLEGRLHAKTGTITNVNTLAGYLTAESGREILFAIFTNGSGVPAAVMRTAIDEVVLTIARHTDERGR